MNYLPKPRLTTRLLHKTRRLGPLSPLLKTAIANPTLLITLSVATFAVLLVGYFITRDYSQKTAYREGEFTATVGQEKDTVKAQFSSGGSQITFALADQKAKKIGQNAFDIGDNAVIDYEIKKEGNDKGLKETITLKNKNAPKRFTFNLELKDVKNFYPNPQDNSWHFFNSEGRRVFYIPAGFMVDAKGARSEQIGISITGKEENYRLEVTADEAWLNNPTRAYPVKIDPSVVVSGTIADTEAQFGGLQKKVVYVNSNWYAFYTDGTDVFYKKSSDGATWGSAVDMDSTDADNLNPTTWVEGSLIYVAWIDDSGEAVEVNTVNTASSDAQGTKCTSASQGTIGSTFTVALTVVDDGTVYFAYSDTSTDTEAAVFKLVFSGCTFTDITTGSGLTASDRPVLTSKGAEAHMIFQDGELSASVYDGTAWITGNETIGQVADNIYDVATDGYTVYALSVSGTEAINFYTYTSLAETTDIDTDVGAAGQASVYCPAADDCKVAYFDRTDQDITFADCNDAACSAPAITDIDTAVGAAGQASIYCPAATDCKVAFFDNTDSDITFADCNDATCSAPTISDIDTDAGNSGRAAIYCPAADDCKVAYADTADQDITFADCNDATCSAPTISDIDAAAGTSGQTSIYCPSATDCKVAFFDNTDSDITFADCNDAACSFADPPTFDIDTDAGTGQASIYCPTATDCKVAYVDDTDADVSFADCNDATCSAPTINDIDTSAGSARVSIYCPAADDCKVAYYDSVLDRDVTFVDCNDAACSAPTFTDIDTDVGIEGFVSIYCVSATDCKVAYYDDTDQDISFADCADATCSTTTCNSGVEANCTDIDTAAGTSNGALSVYCPATDDCKVVFYDDTDGDISFADCADATCSTTTCNSGVEVNCTDIDTDVSTLGANASVYCPTATDCKVAYFDRTDGDITFADCNDATCSAPTISDIDTDAGTTGQASIYCPTATDCKVAYFDSADGDITFADCNDASCSAPTISDIDAEVGAGQVSIYCPTATDCKVAYADAADNDITFADCNDASCSTSTSPNAPWTEQTNVTGVAATYTDMKLYVAGIMDTSEQAYWKVTSTNSISWSAATSFAFTAGDLGQIAIYFTDTDDIEAVLRQGTNLEFSDQYKKKATFKNKVTVKNKTTVK